MFALQLNKIALPIATVFALGISATVAQAAVIDQGDGTFLKTFFNAEKGENVRCTYGGVGAGVSESTDCTIADPLGPGGNTKLEQMVGQELFEIDAWSFDDKINVEDTLLGDMFKITVGTGATTGTWSLLEGFDFPVGESFAIALKAGSAQSGAGSVVYLLDTLATNGTWNTIDLNEKQLSNITLFGTDTPAAPIPLPAAGVLLITALGGMGLISRRRRKTA